MTLDNVHSDPYEAAGRLAKGLGQSLVAAQPNDVVGYHNVYTDYALSLLLFASGHRPVEDPFCYRWQLDEKSGLALIDDKVVNESRRLRVSYLPSVACDQLEYYMQHLKLLHEYLKPKSCSKLKMALYCSLRGIAEQKLPLFFYLSDAGIRGVDYGAIQGIFNTYAASPANINRKWLATALVRQNAPAWLVSACKGHMETATLSNGRYCRESPIELSRIVSELLDPELLSVGWQPCKSKFRPQFGWDNGLPDFTGLGRDLGPVSRYKRRDRKRREAKSMVRDAVESISGVGNKNSASIELVTQARDQLLINLQSQGAPIKYSVELFSRFLMRKFRNSMDVTNLLWSRAERLESTGWESADLKSYRKAVKCRSQFFEYLEVCAKHELEVGYAEVLALRVFTVGFFSAQVKHEIFDAMLNNRCRLVGMKGVFFLKIDDGSVDDGKLIPVDVYTAALSMRLRSMSGAQAGQARRETLKLVKLLGLDCRSLGIAILELSKLVLAILRVEAPGPVHAVASGALQCTGLDLRAITRLLLDKPLAQAGSGPLEPKSGPGRCMTRVACKDPPSAVSQFVRHLRASMSPASQAAYIEKSGNSKRFSHATLSHKQEREYLSKTIQLWMSEHTLPALGQLLGFWGAWLCEHKTRHNNIIHAKTVVDYISLVSKSLHHCAGEFVLQFDADEWESTYLSAIEGAALGGMNALASRLYDFHAYLVAFWDVPVIEWDDIYSLAGGLNVATKVDANVVTYSEYESILEYLLGQESRVPEARFSAWLIFLGFRFGLRWSEAYFLQFNDVLKGGPENVYLQVRGNACRGLKSVSANRCVHLVGALSEVERNLLIKCFCANDPFMKGALRSYPTFACHL